MSKILTTNEYFVVTFVLSKILGGMTFGNLPGMEPAAPVVIADGETFNFADYGTVAHEQVAIFNYLTTLFDQPTGDWDGWYIEPQYYGLFHYVLMIIVDHCSSWTYRRIVCNTCRSWICDATIGDIGIADNCLADTSIRKNLPSSDVLVDT